MRTTLNIDHDVLMAVKEVAARESKGNYTDGLTPSERSESIGGWPGGFLTYGALSGRWFRSLGRYGPLSRGYGAEA